jgi:VanZ family protein
VTRRLVLLSVFVVVAATLLLVPLPIAETYAGRTIENAGHTPLFFVGTLFVLAILRQDFGIGGVRLYALAGLLGALTGVLSEILQTPFNRDASWEDVTADCVGVLLALAVYATLRPREVNRRVTRAAALLIVGGCLVAYLAPIVSMVRAYVHRDGQFPVLARFDSPVELYWIVGFGIKREIRDDVLDIEFDAAQFPGLSFHEPVPDWRRFTTLAVDVENPETRLLKLGVRVHDIGHGRAFFDRFNRGFELAGGERRTLRVPLEEIRHAPRNRLMNMAEISDVTLFRVHDSPSQHMRLHSMWLE